MVTGFRPTRLIQIRKYPNGYNIRLTKSSALSDEETPYTALSYCWGGDQPHKLTSETLTHGVKQFDDMPQTIRDAIILTAELGFQYLFVDSLCIVQDDDIEKRREIAQMPLIYSNAVVTIAASTASSVFDGFLNDRDVEDVIINMSFEDLDGEKHAIACATERFSIMPLDLRGWALQEHLLASRILQFRPRQLRFLCPTSCESPSASYTDGYVPGSRVEEVLHFPQSFSDLEDFERYWHKVVRLYSSRDLTVPTDRILAISGVARRLTPRVIGYLYFLEICFGT